MMKRKASRAAPFQPPAKLNKRSTSATVSRQANLTPYTAPRQNIPPTVPARALPATSRPRPVAPPRRTLLPLPKWPTLVPTNRPARKASESKAASAASLQLSAASGVSEVCEEQTVVVPGLRRLSTLPLDDEEDRVCASEGLPSTVRSARSSLAGKKGRSGVGRGGKQSQVILDLIDPSSFAKSAPLTKSTSRTKSITRKMSPSLTKAQPPVKALSSIRVTGSDAPLLDEDGADSSVTPAACKVKVKDTAGKGRAKATTVKGKVKATAVKGKVKATRAKVKAVAKKTKSKTTKPVKGKQSGKGRKPGKAVKGKKATGVKAKRK